MYKLDVLRGKISGHGDVQEIANITGYNASYVRKVLMGQRNSDLIVRVANDLVMMREKIYDKYKNIKIEV